MPLGKEVGLSPGDIVLDEDSSRLFSAHVYCGKTVANLSSSLTSVNSQVRTIIDDNQRLLSLIVLTWLFHAKLLFSLTPAIFYNRSNNRNKIVGYSRQQSHSC